MHEDDHTLNGRRDKPFPCCVQGRIVDQGRSLVVDIRYIPIRDFSIRDIWKGVVNGGPCKLLGICIWSQKPYQQGKQNGSHRGCEL